VNIDRYIRFICILHAKTKELFMSLLPRQSSRRAPVLRPKTSKKKMDQKTFQFLFRIRHMKMNSRI